MRFILVGGGPSLINFEYWTQLNRHPNIIAINRAYKKIPAADYIYFSDYRFFDWFKTDLAFINHSAVKITCAKVDHRDVVRYRFSTDGAPLSFQKGVLKGGNCSGYAAINLAVQLGAKQIFLLGYDMQQIENRSNWHNDYPTRADADTYKQMITSFYKLPEVLHDLKIEIVNVNSQSALTMFPAISLAEFVEKIV